MTQPHPPPNPAPHQPEGTDPMTTIIPPRGDDADQVLNEKLRDALTPGFVAEFDPDEAQRAGAFVEDALSERDAADSAPDLEEAFTQRKAGK